MILDNISIVQVIHVLLKSSNKSLKSELSQDLSIPSLLSTNKTDV